MTPNDQRQPRRDLIPEIDRMVEQIRAHPDYWVPSKVTEMYRSLGLTTLPDPFCAEVPDFIAKALREERPCSVVRLGDGEINILSLGAYDTPHLDRFCAAASIRKRADTFIPSDLWLLELREMMMAAVAQADIVGVVGLWRPRAVDAEAFMADVKRKLRGYSGHWRGIDYMLRLARGGSGRQGRRVGASLFRRARASGPAFPRGQERTPRDQLHGSFEAPEETIPRNRNRHAADQPA
jgi:hypothetical protein